MTRLADSAYPHRLPAFFLSLMQPRKGQPFPPERRNCGHTFQSVLQFRLPSAPQRYNTLDFPRESRVPTGMLLAPIGNPAAKRCSLCNPSFSSQVHIQTAKTQLATTAQKMQKEACAGTWHRLPFGRKCRRRRGVFFCIPAIRCGGDGGGRIETGVLAIKKSWIVYRLQHYENRRLFDFLLRTEPTVDAT